jgi:hypothetical protein
MLTQQYQKKMLKCNKNNYKSTKNETQQKIISWNVYIVVDHLTVTVMT